MRKLFALPILFVLLSPAALPQNLFQENDTPDGTPQTALNWNFNWIDLNIKTELSLNVRDMKLRFPTGRLIAENNLKTEYLSHIKKVLYSIQVDSSSTIKDRLEQGRVTVPELEEFLLSAKSVPSFFSDDLHYIKGSYFIDLKKLSSKLVRHKKIMDFMHIINPEDTPRWTGLVIIADGELPVHGKHSKSFLRPCLFPKIRDKDMNTVFESRNTDPDIFERGAMIHYKTRDHVFARTASGMSEELIDIVGKNPMRIIALEVFGKTPTDLVIDNEDARLLLSSESNKKFLREGRIVIISANLEESGSLGE